MLLVVPALAGAQGVEAVGIRALGMGGAFVAVADDASATYWNPAGLVTGDVVSVVAETGLARLDDAPVGHASVPAGSVESTRLGGTLIALSTWPVGATYYRLASSSAVVITSGGAARPELSTTALERLVTTHAGVNVLHTLVPGLHVGTTLKYVHGSAGVGVDHGIPGNSIDEAGALPTVGSHAFDMDAGVMADLRRVKIGIVGRNLFEPAFDTASQGVRLQLPRQFRAGVAVRATDDLMLSVDTDLTSTPDVVGDRRSLAVGAEQRFWQRRAAVRGGFRVSTTGETRPILSTGASVALRSGMFADGYVAIGLDDTAPDAFGLGLRIAF